MFDIVQIAARPVALPLAAVVPCTKQLGAEIWVGNEKTNEHKTHKLVVIKKLFAGLSRDLLGILLMCS